MFSLLLWIQGQSVVVGLDFGHANIKAGMGKFSGVVAVNNHQSKKLSPSFFAFWNFSDPLNSAPPNGSHWSLEDIENCTWEYTSRAQSQAARYPNTAIKSFFPLLNESIGLTHREAMAISLRYLLFTIDSGVYSPEKTMLALSVEPFLSRHQRYALKEVARLANTTLTHIVDSPIAVANYYVLGRTKRLSNDICFVDIGATGTWISIFSFSSMGKDVIMNQKSIVSNGTLGGQYIDHIVGDFLYNKFVEQTGQKSENPKVRNRFYEAAKAAKERLSIEREYTINIEDVIEEYGISYHMTREEFNTLIMPFADALGELIKDAMTKAKVEKIDTVEAIGGNSRPQLLHEVMANVTKVGNISHTLNPEEAVILGTTILASTKSSSYRLPKKIKATVFCNTNIDIEVNGNRSQLFAPKDKAEKFMIRTYQVGEVNDTNFTIYADGDYEKPLDIFSINMPENITEDAEVMIKFGFDEFTLPYINKIEVSGKKVNVTHYFSDWQLNEERFNQSQSFILKMEGIQEDRKNASSTRNEYESYLWSIREKMENDEEFKSFLTENDTLNIMNGLEEHQAWLDNLTSPYVHAQLFRDQIESFKGITKDPEMRQEEFKLIPESVEQLNKTLNEIDKFLTDEVPKKKPWLWTGYRSSMDNLVDNYNHTKEWLEENIYSFTHLNKTVNPETKHNQINVKKQILEFNFNGTRKRKKPTPTPVGFTYPPPTPTPERHRSRHRHSDSDTDHDPEFRDEHSGPDHRGKRHRHHRHHHSDFSSSSDFDSEELKPLSREEIEKKIRDRAKNREQKIMQRHEKRRQKFEEFQKQRQEAIERGETPPVFEPSESERSKRRRSRIREEMEEVERRKKLNEEHASNETTGDNKEAEANEVKQEEHIEKAEESKIEETKVEDLKDENIVSDNQEL